MAPYRRARENECGVGRYEASNEPKAARSPASNPSWDERLDAVPDGHGIGAPPLSGNVQIIDSGS